MSEYTAITGMSLIENTEIEFDLFLKNGTGGQSKYVLFCRGNEQFSPERREELFSKKGGKLYISTKDTDKYFKYQEKNLKAIVNDKSKSSREKSGAVYQVAENLVANLLDDPKSGQNMERVSAWVSSTVSHILQDDNTFSSLFKVTSHDYKIYTHSINMSVIGLLFGKHISLKPNELNRLGAGMLLHDIGKTTIPLNVINKSGRLTGKEFKAVEKHPKAGMELLEHRASVDIMSLKIVIQHHENYDGTGYPYGIGGTEIHLFGLIGRIIDVYDAMTSNRPYADAKRPFAVLAEMKGKMSNCFSEELLREFICFLGPKDSRKKIRANDILYSIPSVTK